MRSALLKHGYSFDEQVAIWSRPEYKGIPYNDGDEIEERIESIITGAQDRSVLSQELARNCSDWPSYYHLSTSRANILRPFEASLKGAAVLEVGAGCGAITRYLGEVGANVIALEGSLRRARIARKRTADLSSIEVVCDNFESFSSDQTFDIITLIGVLEYAPLFIQGEDPFGSLLRKVRSLLKPTGRLILAIENKLGLKYLAGAPEDHIGIPMYGIESRYGKDQPTTFGKGELQRMLSGAGFSSSEFWAPFPDYKAPVSIISPAGLTAPDFDPLALLRHSIHADRQLPAVTSFSVSRAWEAVAKNGLISDLANSFLISAACSSGQSETSGVLAFHFNTNRIPLFCKISSFNRTPTGEIEVQYRRLLHNAPPSDTPTGIRMTLPDRAAYRCGRLLSNTLLDILATPGWTTQDVAHFFAPYISWIGQHSSDDKGRSSDFSAHTQIPGTLFDAIPQNLILTTSGEWEVIDSEWTLEEPIPLGWLIFRGLLSAILPHPYIARSGTDLPSTRQSFAMGVYRALGLEITERQLKEYSTAEASIQSKILGHRIDSDFWTPSNPIVPSPIVLQQFCSLREDLAKSQDRCLELQAALEAFTSSSSWRLTAPLRSIKRLSTGHKS